MIRTSSLLFVVALSACGGAQGGSSDAPPSPTSSPNGSASPDGSIAPIVTSAPATSAAPTTSVAPPVDTTTKGAIDLAHTASSSAGPAPKASTSAAPMSPPTAAELDVIAMCLGKKSIFTEKEQKLLDLADKSDEQALRDTANTIRSRRKEMIEIACNKLRDEGKY